jgi:peptidoglycan/LPS O-acetylase OafA/YrhL
MTSVVAATTTAAHGSPDLEGRGYRPDGRLAHLPPLDGIRGLGIPFVMLYHHAGSLFGVSFGGGFLTVSMFFTLSGFLITRLLVNEHDRHGSLDLKQFYVRRFRRLMPAALVVLALISLAWWAFPSPTRSLSFPAFASAMFYGENLYLIAQGNSYFNLFADRSPVQHMWSLSLEEQVYIVFPLIMIAILAVPMLRRRAATILTVLAVAAFAMGFYWRTVGGNERAYYATEARAAEFLAGAAMAVFWLRSRWVPAITRFLRSNVGLAASAAVLAAEVWLWLSVDLRTTWFFPWAVAVNSLVVCIIMAYSSAGCGLSGFLSLRPLTFLGQLSYGLYLVHWPVFLFLTPDLVGLSSELLFALRTAVTFAITLAVFQLIENPVRTKRMWNGRSFVVATAVLMALGLGFAAAANDSSAVKTLVDEGALEIQRQALAALPDVGDDSPTRSVIDPSLPARVLVVGDSQSWIVGNGMRDLWAGPVGVQVEASPGVGCGVGGITPIVYLGEEFPDGSPGCREWRDALPRIVEKYRPQLVVVVGGLADVSDRKIPGSSGWTHIGEPGYDDWLTAQMDAFTDVITAQGATVLWMTHPNVRPPRPPGSDAFVEEDPARVSSYNELIRSLASRDQRVGDADLASFVQQRPGGEFDPQFRPDGAHFDLSVAPDLVTWIADQIRRATPPA